MKTAKKFDCVKVKDEIQAKLADEYDGLSDEETRKRIQEKPAASDSAVARLRRSLPKPGVENR
ncbi:MAG: hypothetical protein V3W34_19630 [Phycisphaerae bacterium]